MKNTSSPQKTEAPDIKKTLERLIAEAPVDKTTRYPQQTRSPCIQRHQQQQFFPPGHNGRGSKD